MTSTIGRGLLAGAFGTLLLNAATYLDMALTGRPASDVPGRMMLRTAHAAGLQPPDDEARTEAYGALGGIATGLALGVGASAARAVGVRVPAPLGAVLTGAAAMAAPHVAPPRWGGSARAPPPWSPPTCRWPVRASRIPATGPRPTGPATRSRTWSSVP